MSGAPHLQKKQYGGLIQSDYEDEALSASQINEENSIIMNNGNGARQQHDFNGGGQLLQEAGEIMDQDDEGGNFFLGSGDEESGNAPADENSNCYRLSSQMDD